MQSHLVDAVPVEVPHERLVARVSEDEGPLGGPEPGVAGAETVDHVEALLGRAVDGHGVAAVAVEVAGDWDVARVAEEEFDVCHAFGVGVAQVDIAV